MKKNKPYENIINMLINMIGIMLLIDTILLLIIIPYCLVGLLNLLLNPPYLPCI